MTAAAPAPTAPTGKPPRDHLALGLTLAVVAFAAAVRLLYPPDPNIDWLTTVARIVANGGRLGRDIVETNPPMAVWIQLPAVIIERWTGWAAETVQIWLVFTLALAMAEHLTRRLASLGAATRFDRPILHAVLLLFPLSAFAEREHVGLILVAPLLGLTLARAAGRSAATSDIVIAGLAAGIAAMIKPQFALPTLLLAVYVALRFRAPLKLLLPEFLLAGGLTLAYAGAVVVLVPDYVRDVLPAVLDVYRPVKYGLGAMLLSLKAAEWLAVVAALAWLMRRRLAQPETAVWLVASAGFLVAFLEQGRGWPYHVYPAAALAAVAMLRAAPAALTSGDPRQRVPAIIGILACLMPVPNLGFFPYPNHDIVAAIRAARPRPTIAAISMDLTPGHPITTDVGGLWVGTHSSRWLTVYAGMRKAMTADPEIIARCDAWMAYDRAATNRDLAEKRPDIVLVGTGDRDWHRWIAADPETARLMANYRLLARQAISPADANRFEAVEAWIRADLVTAAR
jgi:hypothetical protein